MKKLSSQLLVVAFVVAGSFSLSLLSVHAQTVSGTTPTFYNQSGMVLNSGGTPIGAGWYYLQNGDQAYYYGNGTYYDSTAGVYGGSIFGSSVAAGTVNGATPVLYNQSGQAVNPSGTALAAGYYYLANGNQVYYYGNGTYFNNATNTYGGMIFGGTIASAGTPSAPNTGMGGESYMNWILLVATAMVFLGGATYVFRSTRPATILS